MDGGDTYICIKQFNARLGDELSLKIGDKIQVLADDREYNDGWYMGKNLLTGEAGLYPKTFTQLITNNDSKTLLRSRSRRMMAPKSSDQETTPKDTTTPVVSSNLNPNTPPNYPPTLSSSTEPSHLAEPMSQLNLNKDSQSSQYTGSHLNSQIDRALQELQGSNADLTNSGNSFNEHRNHHYNNNTNNNNNNNNAATSNNYKQPQLMSKKSNDSLSSQYQYQSQSQQPKHLSGDKSRQSLTDDLDPLKANTWTPKQVSSYFALVLGFDMDVAGKFAQHKITGEILFELDLNLLKELDIDSFGTRFKLYKEIGKLKELNTEGVKDKQLRTDSLSTGSTGKNDTTSSALNSPPTASTTLHDAVPHIDDNNMLNNTGKQQTQLMPSAVLTNTSDYNNNSQQQSGSQHHQRKRSLSVDVAPQQYLASDSTFMSPRRAPQPPSGESPIDTSYKFGAGSEYDRPPSHYGMYMTRTNASSHALGSSSPGINSRPASSIYDLFSNHNRNGSSTSKQHHKRNSSVTNNNNNNNGNSNHKHHHRRHSSVFSYLSSGNDDSTKPTPKLLSSKFQSNNLYKGGDDGHGDFTSSSNNNNNNSKLVSPAQIKRETTSGQSSLHESGSKSKGKSQIFDLSNSPVDIDDAKFSPKKLNSVSVRTKSMDAIGGNGDDRRVASDSTGLSQSKPNNSSRLKGIRATSTQSFRSLTGSKKLKTSAFQEGIREITPDEAIKTASHSGYMSKRSNNNLAWRTRYFTLHGTRLSYFQSLKDKKEKGLIDITAHKVIPIDSASDDTDKADRYAAMYASTTFAGNYCFKLVPPAPGFKKGLTFTQPKTHYFAVETEEEMRAWVKALMQATIDIDDSVPVVSSCSTPTVSLNKAQELLAKAREETKLRDEQLKANGYIRSLEDINDTSFLASLDYPDMSGDIGFGSTSPVAATSAPKLTLDTNFNRKSSGTMGTTGTIGTPGTSGGTVPTTPQIPRSSSQSGGFASPYLLASGLLSPKSGGGAGPGGIVSSSSPINENGPLRNSTSNSEYFGDITYKSLKPPSRQNSQYASITSGGGSIGFGYGSNNSGLGGPATAIGGGGGGVLSSSTPYSTGSGSTASSMNYNNHNNNNNNNNSVNSPINEFRSSRDLKSSSSPTTTTGTSSTSGKKPQSRRTSDKMLGFSSDASGSHTFVIKPKK